MAISDRARAGKLFVVEALILAEQKTKAAKAVLEKLGVKHALIVVGGGEEGFIRAARNLAAHKPLVEKALNVYDVLKYDELVMTAKAARAVEQRLGADVR
jgi:large subunit ribosomal protein L4